MSSEPACFKNIGDTDHLDYCPISDGVIPPSSGRMTVLPHYDDPEKNKIFQFDKDTFHLYRNAKVAVSDMEDSWRYYQKRQDPPKEVVKFILDKLLTENSKFFSWNNSILFCYLTKESLLFDQELNYVRTLYDGRQYRDTMDAVGHQVCEDLVVHAYDPEKDRDYAECIHLSHANGWGADWAIGRDFGHIHKEVHGIDKIIPRPGRLVRGIIRGGRTSERIGAISFRTDTRLNRHPALEGEYKHLPFNVNDPSLCMRFERQTVTGFPGANRFLFTIRTYFVNCDQRGIDDDKHKKILEAFKNTDVSTVYSREFLEKNRYDIVKWLSNDNKE